MTTQYPLLKVLTESGPTGEHHMPEPEVPVPSAIQTAEEVEAIIKKVHAFNVKRWEDIIRRSADYNGGVSPIVDRNGRYHAPNDGYTDPDTDRVYRGGAYLPFPEEYYERDGELRFRGGGYTSRQGWRYQERIRMPLEAANALKAMGEELRAKDKAAYAGYFEVGTGKAWTEGGIEVCYAYIKAAYKPILEAIMKFASKNEHKRPERDQIDPSTFPVWPAARRKIVGTVLSIKAYESMYGTSWKMLIQSEDGNKVFGTAPTSLDIQKGDTVEFEALVEMKEPGFYYFKRPTKAKIVG